MTSVVMNRLNEVVQLSKSFKPSLKRGSEIVEPPRLVRMTIWAELHCASVVMNRLNEVV